MSYYGNRSSAYGNYGSYGQGQYGQGQYGRNTATGGSYNQYSNQRSSYSHPFGNSTQQNQFSNLRFSQNNQHQQRKIGQNTVQRNVKNSTQTLKIQKNPNIVKQKPKQKKIVKKVQKKTKTVVAKKKVPVKKNPKKVVKKATQVKKDTTTIRRSNASKPQKKIVKKTTTTKQPVRKTATKQPVRKTPQYQNQPQRTTTTAQNFSKNSFAKHTHPSYVTSSKTTSNVRNYRAAGGRSKALVNKKGEVLVPKGKQIAIEKCHKTGKKKSKILNIQVLGNPIPAIKKNTYKKEDFGLDSLDELDEDGLPCMVLKRTVSRETYINLDDDVVMDIWTKDTNLSRASMVGIKNIGNSCYM